MDTSTVDQRVAEAVRSAATEHGISQLALSNATGIPRVTLRRKMDGFSSFTIAELTAISDVLGVDPGTLWTAA